MITKTEMLSLSIIVGSQNAAATIRPCLATLVEQAAALAAKGQMVEIIVVDGSADETAVLIQTHFPQLTCLAAPSEALMPQLWKQGLDQARGKVVAFTIAQCIPHPDWLVQIVAAFDNIAPSVAGIGGPITPPKNHRGLDWALYFARYNAFLPPREAAVPQAIQDVPGDNAAYRRAALAACEDAMADGFWETLVHICLHEEGGVLSWQPAMQVRFGPAGSLAAAARLRFQHGRHYGRTRPDNTPVKRLLRALAGPLIALVLLNRITGRVRAARPDWQPQLLRALPALLALVAAWTMGEMLGYIGR